MNHSAIQEVEKIREVFEKDLVLKSKFKDLTYADYFEYKKTLKDTTFQKNLQVMLFIFPGILTQ
ncbi:MAG: hypothetical protein H8D22_05665 [Candidatus Cloacimonetes bacterium]|nr:hypothetical protein [Candidatus Cloacimonadota bacterium]